MAKLTSIPRQRRGPSYRGRVMIDTVRGVIRVRKWPKKRGPPKSESQRFWVDWFTQANRLAKYASGMDQARAIAMTAKSGWYPRDVLLKAMRGRLYWWATPDGWKWYPVAAIGDISETLDVLAQTVGSVLVRATDRWRAPPAATIGDVLTYKGDVASPLWETPAGGVIQQQLTESPISPDNTVSEYIFDVSAYFNVDLIFDKVNIAAIDSIKFRASTDGGVTYHSAASDYFNSYLSSTTEVASNVAQADISDGTGSSNHVIRLAIADLRAPRTSWDCFCGFNTGSAAQRSGWCRFDGPVTHVKAYTGSSNNFSGGVIRAMGNRST